jgi:hypothetical protein
LALIKKFDNHPNQIYEKKAVIDCIKTLLHMQEFCITRERYICKFSGKIGFRANGSHKPIILTITLILTLDVWCD